MSYAIILLGWRYVIIQSQVNLYVVFQEDNRNPC